MPLGQQPQGQSRAHAWLQAGPFDEGPPAVQRSVVRLGRADGENGTEEEGPHFFFLFRPSFAFQHGRGGGKELLFGGRQGHVALELMGQQRDLALAGQGELAAPKRAYVALGAVEVQGQVRQAVFKEARGRPGATLGQLFSGVFLGSIFLLVGRERRLLHGQSTLAIPRAGIEFAAPSRHALIRGARTVPALQIVRGFLDAVRPHHQVHGFLPEIFFLGPHRDGHFRGFDGALHVMEGPSGLPHRHRPPHVPGTALPLLLEEDQQVLALSGALGRAARRQQPVPLGAAIQRFDPQARRLRPGLFQIRGAGQLVVQVRMQLGLQLEGFGLGQEIGIPGWILLEGQAGLQVDGAQAVGIVQVLLGQQQGHGAAGLGQVRGREGFGGKALKEALLVARGGARHDFFKHGTGFLAHTHAVEEGQPIFQQAQAPGMACGDACPFLGGGGHALGALHVGGALDFGLQFHGALGQGIDAGFQGVPDAIGVRHAAVVGQIACPGGFQSDAVLLTGHEFGAAGHDGVPIGDDAVLLPAGLDELAAPGLDGIQEGRGAGLADHLPALLQQGVAQAVNGVVFRGPVGVALVITRFPSLGIVGHVHAIHPVVGVILEAGLGRFQRGDGQEGRQCVFILRRARMELLDALLHAAVDLVPGKQLGQAAQGALVPLEPREIAVSGFRAQSIQIFTDGPIQILHVLPQHAGLESEETGTAHGLTALFDDLKCLLVVVVVPEQRGQLGDARGIARVAAQDVFPDLHGRRGLAAVFFHLAQFGPEGRSVQQGRRRALHEIPGDGAVGSLQAIQAAVQRKHAAGQVAIAGIARQEAISGA